MVISEILDVIGVGLGKWAYPIKVVPIANLNFLFRLSVLPVLFMLFLQFKPQFNPFIKAVL